VVDFGKIKIKYLREYLPYKNGIPSDDTFRRFFRAINPEKFQELFRQWVRILSPNLNDNVIAIDGKSSRRSYDDDKKMLHTISAYATESRLVLGQEKVSDKSNEITAIPKLLEWLDIKGRIITIDAMGCQYKIANQILKQQGDYIFCLKGNQGTLHEDIKLYFSDQALVNKSANHCDDYDKGHGRIEHRKCSIVSDVDWLKERHTEWGSIKSIIRIESTREIKEKISMETRYYISSLVQTADKTLSSIRSHWAIENSLHWVLDMSFGDDQSRIRKENAPQVMAVMRHIALNLLQFAKAQMKRQSIKRLRKMAGWDNQILAYILQQKFS
jgi:predicted transposase YbfD/YdcC